MTNSHRPSGRFSRYPAVNREGRVRVRRVPAVTMEPEAPAVSSAADDLAAAAAFADLALSADTMEGAALAEAGLAPGDFQAYLASLIEAQERTKAYTPDDAPDLAVEPTIEGLPAAPIPEPNPNPPVDAPAPTPVQQAVEAASFSADEEAVRRQTLEADLERAAAAVHRQATAEVEAEIAADPLTVPVSGEPWSVDPPEPDDTVEITPMVDGQSSATTVVDEDAEDEVVEADVWPTAAELHEFSVRRLVAYVQDAEDAEQKELRRAWVLEVEAAGPNRSTAIARVTKA